MTRQPGWKLLAAVWVAMMALRQDFWLWTDGSLVFGFLPIGLAYHAAYSVVAALVMALLVHFAWPRHLEELEEPAPGKQEKPSQ